MPATLTEVGVGPEIKQSEATAEQVYVTVAPAVRLEDATPSWQNRLKYGSIAAVFLLAIVTVLMASHPFWEIFKAIAANEP